MTLDVAALTKAEKRQLYDQLAYEFARSDAKTLGRAVDNELWGLIHDAIGVRAKRQPLGEFLKDYGKGRYEEREQMLDLLLADAMPDGQTRTVTLAVKRSVLDSLVALLKAKGFPVTPKVMLNSFSLLRAAVNRDFPGYMDAKLLHRVAVAFADKVA